VRGAPQIRRDRCPQRVPTITPSSASADYQFDPFCGILVASTAKSLSAAWSRSSSSPDWYSLRCPRLSWPARCRMLRCPGWRTICRCPQPPTKWQATCRAVRPRRRRRSVATNACSWPPACRNASPACRRSSSIRGSRPRKMSWPCGMIPGPMIWAVRLPSILLELWSDRRFQRRLLLRGPKTARINACRLAATKDN